MIDEEEQERIVNYYVGRLPLYDSKVIRPVLEAMLEEVLLTIKHERLQRDIKAVHFALNQYRHG